MSKSIIMRFLFLTLVFVFQLCCSEEKNINDDITLVSPINLDHALALVDSIVIDDQNLTFIWIYADAPSYEPIGASGEGITCVDDVGRFMEVLETEILVYGKNELIPIAEGMTRFLLYMSRDDGLWYNFMFENGSINTAHQNSIAEFGWWAVRGLRGLTSAYNIFEDQIGYTDFVVNIENRINSANIHIEEAISQYPAQVLTELGMRPGWLVKNAPDMNSELLYVLTKLQNTGDFDFYEAIEKISKGIVKYQYQIPDHDLKGMYLCWNNIWHNWGNNQALGLLEAYKITADSTLLNSVENWADYFIPYLLENEFLWEINVKFNQGFTTVQFPQIAYGFNSIYRGIKTLASVTENEEYINLSEYVFSWFQGQNIAQTPMYYSNTGICFDGIDNLSSVNMNSGAESTIECLLAIQYRGNY